MKSIYLFLLLLTINCASYRANSSPAYPYPVTIKQPNGKMITILLLGDENNKSIQSMDGYTLIRGKNNYIEYATLDKNKNLVPSGIEASNIESRNSKEISFLKTCKKEICISSYQKLTRSKTNRFNGEGESRSFPTTGNRKLLCILIGFKDRAFTKSETDFNNLFNKIGYNENTASGSVKDYYLENSYGQLDLSITVVGPYTASENMAYYGQSDGDDHDKNPMALIDEAVTLANKDVNYSDFDNDGDGSVDGVYVIYAGYGEEAGGDPSAIWAHAFNITTKTLDGKRIFKYSCSPELSGNSGTTISTIGVICHEFGHVLGAPDYYDTDYEKSGGEYPGTLKYDIMASGAWNNQGKTPAHHNGYTKTFIYNWATPQDLTSTQSVTLNPAGSNKTNAFYTIQTQLDGEFFFLENRQLSGFDKYIPGNGMLIYRVGASINSKGNHINAEFPQQMYLLCSGASTEPSISPSTYGNTGFPKRWPYPGSLFKNSFTDETIPSAKSSTGIPTGLPITNIEENTTTGVVTFQLTKSITDVESPTTIENRCEPSPFGSYLTITSQAALKTILIYDMTGKTVIVQAALRETIQSINTEALASGYYLVKLVDITGKTTTIKTVKL